MSEPTNDRFHSGLRQHTTKPPRANWRGWTDAEIAVIRSMAGTATSAQIAERLNRTSNQVKHMACQQGISLRLYGERSPVAKYTDAHVERARDLHEAGMKPKQIAKHLGLPYWAVCDFVYYKRGLGYHVEH